MFVVTLKFHLRAAAVWSGTPTGGRQYTDDNTILQ